MNVGARAQLKPPPTITDLTARDLQRQAADPSHSVWVSASAGTGKTRVLIDRVLRLLLPRDDGTPGTRPDRVLCLTYTRAAAAEMTERLLARLSRWAVMDENDLVTELGDLFGVPPNAHQQKAARALFARLVDGPEQVRIMTIHAFCQSILARFPLESGLPPHFELIEGTRVTELLQRARQQVLRAAGQNRDLRTALDLIMAEMSDDTFTRLFDELFKEKRQLTYALMSHAGPARGSVMRTQLGLHADYTSDDWQSEVAAFHRHEEPRLKELSAAFNNPPATKAEQELGVCVQAWLLQGHDFNALLPAFFGKDGKKRGGGRHQGVRKNNPHIADIYEALQDQVDDLLSRRKTLELIDVNLALLQVVEAVMQSYDRLKRDQAVLDFDDIIRYTLRLLQVDQVHGQANILSWVMYKLDGGIDHVLVDEAQDTNPEQWLIIKALTTAFFDDVGAQAKLDRTLFVVGDQKQSIYSFQGADPESFAASLTQLTQTRNTPAQNVFTRIPLNTSFRSSAAILTLVDQVFDDGNLRTHLREEDVMTHLVHRVGQGGQVEIWPLEKNEKEERVARHGWRAGLEVSVNDDVYDRLARNIARHIRGWLDRGEVLASHNRPIKPGDIMILVGKRQPLLPRLVAALRRVNVPVGGQDRLYLADELAVRDVLACTQFALSPDDDLNLACVLKSPLVGLNDDDLIKLAPGRPGSLWQAVQDHANYQGVVAYLTELHTRAVTHHPHGFFNALLNGACPGDPHGSGLRALKNRLGDDCAEPLDELMNMVLTMDHDGQSLLHIIQQIIQENPEIKREGVPTHNVVRLMTVHGSKGLEAPIVILPDTVRSSHDPKAAPTLFWPDDTGMALPMWSPRRDGRPPAFTDVITRAAFATQAEYNRLLYVALTRAQDRLIIAGAQKNVSRTDENSWYFTVLRGFERLTAMPGYGCEGDDDNSLQRYHVPQKAKADREDQLVKVNNASEQQNMPALLSLPLSHEPAPHRPYRAEAASGPPLPRSPLVVQQDPARFQRGLITHKLLQVLPNVVPAQWESAAQSYLSQQGDAFDAGKQEQIKNEVLAILRAPHFAPVFGPGSRAEVPITGLLKDGRLIAGQIDRLLITPTRILIIDYKTNRAPPQDVADVPVAYLRQLAAYAELLQALYPNRPVEAGLIWTEGPYFMDLTNLIPK